jgi:hypothetical protein
MPCRVPGRVVVCVTAFVAGSMRETVSSRKFAT